MVRLVNISGSNEERRRILMTNGLTRQAFHADTVQQTEGSAGNRRTKQCPSRLSHGIDGLFVFGTLANTIIELTGGVSKAVPLLRRTALL